MTAQSIADLLLTVYAQAEPIASGRDEFSGLDRNVEEAMAFGRHFFDALRENVRLWESRVRTAEIRFRQEDWERFQTAYRRWLATSRKVLETADILAAAGNEPAGLEAFRAAVGEAESLLEAGLTAEFAEYAALDDEEATARAEASALSSKELEHLAARLDRERHRFDNSGLEF